MSCSRKLGRNLDNLVQLYWMRYRHRDIRIIEYAYSFQSKFPNYCFILRDIYRKLGFNART